jgi:hypothetical protein
MNRDGVEVTPLASVACGNLSSLASLVKSYQSFFAGEPFYLFNIACYIRASVLIGLGL